MRCALIPFQSSSRVEGFLWGCGCSINNLFWERGYLSSSFIHEDTSLVKGNYRNGVDLVLTLSILSSQYPKVSKLSMFVTSYTSRRPLKVQRTNIIIFIIIIITVVVTCTFVFLYWNLVMLLKRSCPAVSLEKCVNGSETEQSIVSQGCLVDFYFMPPHQDSSYTRCKPLRWGRICFPRDQRSSTIKPLCAGDAQRILSPSAAHSNFCTIIYSE